jgi:hypothetical protein
MNALRPRYGKEEFARHGDRIYDEFVRPQLRPDDAGKFVAIDIESGAFEVDADKLAASDRLLARQPQGQAWLRRVGSHSLRRVRQARMAG